MQKNNLRDTEELLKFRPLISSKKFECISESETFQNQTLRPIIKLQNDVLLQLVARASNFPDRNKIKTRTSFENKLKAFISQADLKFSILGIVVGMMTEQELHFYFENAKDCNKRIYGIVLERLVDRMF